MNIGELAQRTNTSARSLRYYEKQQLLSSHRQENGYRSYDKMAIEQVRHIQFYLRMGLTAQQIYHIVSCGRPDSAPSPFDETDFPRCPEAIDLYERKLSEIEAQIAKLEQAKVYLRQRLALFTSAETPGAPGRREA